MTGFFISPDVCKVHPCCSGYQGFIPFSDQIIICVWLYHILSLQMVLDTGLFSSFSSCEWCHHAHSCLSSNTGFQFSWVYPGVQVLGHVMYPVSFVSHFVVLGSKRTMWYVLVAFPICRFNSLFLLLGYKLQGLGCGVIRIFLGVQI